MKLTKEVTIIMEFEQLLERFRKDTGLENLAPDDTDTCTFLVDEMKVSLMHIAEGGRLLLFAEVGELPDGGCPALAMAALKANYLFRGTSGATLAVRPDSSMLFLNQSMLLENLSYDDFVQAISDFVDTIEEWQKMIANYRPMAEVSDVRAAVKDSIRNGYMKI